MRNKAKNIEHERVRYVKSWYKWKQKKHKLVPAEFNVNATLITFHQEWSSKIFRLLKLILFNHQDFKNTNILLDNL